MSLILCGFFCAGKTTLGKLCAEQLKVSFVDTDRLIEQIDGSGKNVAEIWLHKGMKWFRDLETEVIFSLRNEPCVVATGGGSLLRKENREFLKSVGLSVYLKASAEVLYERLLQRGFPAFLDKSHPFEHFHQLFNERYFLYEQHCEHVIETHGFSKNELVQQITKFYGK